MRGEINVSKALLKAESELEHDRQPPPDRRVDDDWLFRWRDAASTVSSDELQSLWGRVLAGKIKSPGSCSLRTLEFLKNLSQNEALQIAQLSPFVIDSKFIFRGDEQLLESERITFMFLQNMQALGIVAGVEAVGMQSTAKSSRSDEFVRHFICHDRILLVNHEEPNRKLKFPVYLLTSLGKEVLRLGSFAANETYLERFGRHIRNHGFDVKIASWIQLTETRGRSYDAQEVVG